MSTETLTLITNPGSYDLGAVNYTTKVVKAINDQFTNPACSGTIEFRLEYCDIATIPANIPIGTGIQFGSTVDLTTWFNTGVNTSIEYNKTIDGVTTVINNPTAFTFNQPENTDVIITLRDTQLTAPECKATVTKTVLNQPATCKTYIISIGIPLGPYKPVDITISYIPCNGGFGTEADRVKYNISVPGNYKTGGIDMSIRTPDGKSIACILEGSLKVSVSANAQLTRIHPSATCNI